MGQVGNLFVVGLLTIGSGLLDARGFVYAARAWPGGQLDPKVGFLSLASFAGGLTAYILAVKFMQAAGIQGVALQSAIWFVITAVGIAVMDGSILNWTRTQQVVGLVVAVALCWLIATTRAAEASGNLGYTRAMDSRLIEMLACPVSKAPVYFAEARQLIVCPTSKLAYPIKDGIPAMLPEDAIKLEDNDPLLTQKISQ